MSKTQIKPGDVYADKDYVLVALEGADEPLPDPVPKTWLGTELLDPGVVEFKDGAKTPAAKADEPVVIPEGEPDEENWTGKQIDAYGEKVGVDVTKISKKSDKILAITEHVTKPPENTPAS